MQYVLTKTKHFDKLVKSCSPLIEPYDITLLFSPKPRFGSYVYMLEDDAFQHLLNYEDKVQPLCEWNSLYYPISFSSDNTYKATIGGKELTLYYNDKLILNIFNDIMNSVVDSHGWTDLYWPIDRIDKLPDCVFKGVLRDYSEYDNFRQYVTKMFDERTDLAVFMYLLSTAYLNRINLNKLFELI